MTDGGILIDIPQLAYKTWLLQVYDSKGNRLIDAEKDLRESLKEFRYSQKHEHVRN